jgi:trans-2-enoyl-CoA reductase
MTQDCWPWELKTSVWLVKAHLCNEDYDCEVICKDIVEEEAKARAIEYFKDNIPEFDLLVSHISCNKRTMLL